MSIESTQEQAARILEKSIPLTDDYKNYIPVQKSDQILIQQGIVITTLLVDLHRKVDNLTDRINKLDNHVFQSTIDRDKRSLGKEKE